MALKLGIVVPCYNEEEVLPETARRIHEILTRLIVAGKISATSCVYFVDDGSTDRTWTIISAARGPVIGGIRRQAR